MFVQLNEEGTGQFFQSVTGFDFYFTSRRAANVQGEVDSLKFNWFFIWGWPEQLCMKGLDADYG